MSKIAGIRIKQEPRTIAPKKGTLEAIIQSSLAGVLGIDSRPQSNESIGPQRAGTILSLVARGLKKDSLSIDERHEVLRALGKRGFDISRESDAGRRTRIDVGVKSPTLVVDRSAVINRNNAKRLAATAG